MSAMNDNSSPSVKLSRFPRSRWILLSGGATREAMPKRSDTFNRAVGERLRFTRLAMNNMTQEAFYGPAGISSAQASGAENKGKGIGTEKLVRLAEHHGLTMEWICRDDLDGIPHAIAKAIEALRAVPGRRRA